jgi:hypothetical protein
VAGALLALVLGAGSCRHPAITATALGGTIGFGTCMVDSGHLGTCAAIGGGAAVFLGGITALVTLLTNPQEHSLHLDEEPAPPEIIRKPRHPAMVPGDAGVSADAPPADAAPADAM